MQAGNRVNPLDTEDTMADVSDLSANDPGAALRPVIRRLQSKLSDVQGVAVVTGDGLPLATVLDNGADPARFGAMCASLLALAAQAAKEIDRGRLRQVLIEGDDGAMLIVRAGEEAVLAVAAGQSINTGRLFLEARKVAEDVAAIVE